MKTYYHNMALRSKMLLITIVFAATTLPIIALSYSTIDAQSAILRTRLLPEFAKKDWLDDLLLAVSESGGALNQAVALGSGGASDAKLKDLISIGAKYLASIDVALEKLKLSNDFTTAQKTEVLAAAKEFHKAVDEVFEMLDGDPATALAMLQRPNDIYKILRNNIDAMADAQGESLALLKDAIERDANSAITILLLSGLSAYALSFLAVYIIGRSIIKAMSATLRVLNKLANGELSTDIPYLNRKDEIGAIARGLGVFKENALDKIRLDEIHRQDNDNKLAHGERIKSLTKIFEGSANDVVNHVSDAATELQSAAITLTATIEQTSRQSTAVAAAAEQATSNVQIVSAAASELSASINEISRQVAQASKVSSDAVISASRASSVVASLADAAVKIGEVVGLINDIASETNLLALNATIEAAKAGDAGKGFAVVANAVKGLASQTARATGEISKQVTAIQASTQGAVAAIDGVSKVISEISDISNVVAKAVDEQGAATMEISRNVQEAANGTLEVSANIAGVSAAASETREAAIKVRTVADTLSERSTNLGQEVSRFLSDVRAA